MRLSPSTHFAGSIQTNQTPVQKENLNSVSFQEPVVTHLRKAKDTFFAGACFAADEPHAAIRAYSLKLLKEISSGNKSGIERAYRNLQDAVKPHSGDGYAIYHETRMDFFMAVLSGDVEKAKKTYQTFLSVISSGNERVELDGTIPDVEKLQVKMTAAVDAGKMDIAKRRLEELCKLEFQKRQQ